MDYPPIALYELAAAGAVYRVFSPSFANTRWLTVAIKLPALLAEIALAFVLWRAIGRRYGAPAGAPGARPVRAGEAGQWASAACWGNPAMILAGPVLGYLDPLMALPAVSAIIAAAGGYAAVAGALLAIACLTKAQAVFVAPVVALALWNAGTAGRMWRAATGLASAIVVSVAALLPYIIAGAWRNLVQGVGSLLRHDMLSADAANVWWLFTYVMRAVYAVKDMGVWGAWTMRLRILGISTIVKLGYPSPRLGATLAVCAAAAWALWRARRSPDMAVMLACAAFVVHAYFVLGVQVHENHLYLAIPLLAAAAATRPRLRPVLLGASIVFALNLYLFFGLGRGLPLPPRNLTVIDSTVLVALANCALLVWHAKRYSAECAASAAHSR